MATSPEFYARRVTLDDLKYAQQATDIFNAAYGANNNNWASVNRIVTGYFITKEDMEKSFRESVAGNTIQLLLFQKDEEGNDKVVVGTLTVEGSGLLGKFAVDVAHHSKGLGKILINKAFEEMKKSNFAVCYIMVVESRTNLINWFKKLGFVDTMERIPFAPPEGVVLHDNTPFATFRKALK